jgi:hypothetical protein
MKKLLLGAWLWLATCIPTLANVPCTVPFNLTNGTTADASQVMANYNAILSCLGSAAASGINSDITQLLGLTSPFTPSQGGTPVFIGGTSGGSGNAQTVSATLPNNFTLTQDYQVIFKAGFTNSGATTLNVAGTGPTNLFKQSITGPVALTGSEIQAGQIVFAFYDGTQWEMLPPLNLAAGFGTAVASGNTISISTTAPPYGFDQPVNMGLTAVQNTPSANLLKVCVTTAAGATPTAANPVLIPFTNNGQVTWLTITAAHCMDTNGVGASLGTQSSGACPGATCFPFRFWIVEFNNAGTPVPSLWHSGAGAAQPSISPLDETSTQSSTAISNAAQSAATYYTPNGITVTNKQIKILGYVEWNAGLATAGSYASAPTKIQLFGPGVKKPGDYVQVINTTSAINSLNIAPTSSINLVEYNYGANLTGTTAAGIFQMTANGVLKRQGTTIQTVVVTVYGSAGGQTTTNPVSWLSVDNPAVNASAIAYTISGTGNFNSFGGQNLTLKEVQG